MNENSAWKLESFVDALVVELDKTRETLGVKAINKPLSYTVKDMAMDLQIFPTYNGENVEFVTAQPGEEGASKISIQLSPITDRQVRESSKDPVASTDIAIEDVPVDDETKRELRRVGVRSVADLERMEDRNVDLGNVVKKGTNFSELADAIRSSRRAKRPPRVRSASLSRSEPGVAEFEVRGLALAVDESFEPVAVVNGELAVTVAASEDSLCVSCPETLLSHGDNELVMVLDPHSVVRLTVQHNAKEQDR